MDLSQEVETKLVADAACDIDTIKSDGADETQVDEEKGEESGNKTQSTIDDKAECADKEANITESCNKGDAEEQNVSSSWVFVDVKSSAGKSDNTRKFYLNCSEEPVQELHQHELSAHNSGSDSDTDGISVISESDSSKIEEGGVLHHKIFSEQVDVNCQSASTVMREETRGTTEVSQVIRTSLSTQRSALTFNQLSYLAAFSIVILLIPLQWYFQLYDFDRKEVEMNNGKIPNIPNNIEVNSQKAEHIDSDRLVIDDPFAYCTKIHENSDYMYKSRNVKKCMKKLERVKEKLNRVHQKLQNTIPESEDGDGHEDIEEIHLNYKAEYSKLNNNENKHEVYTKKVKYRKPNESKGRKKYEKEYRIIRNTTNKEAKAYKFEYYSDKDNSTSLNRPEIELKHRPKINGDEISKKYSDYESKLKAKEKYLREKEQYLHLKEKELKEREMKSHHVPENTAHLDGKNDKVQNETSRYYNNSKMKKKVYKHEAAHKLDDSDNDAEKRHHKKKAKYSADFLPHDDSSEYRAKHSHHKINNKNEKDHLKQKDTQSDESSNDKNGGWYDNLFEERSKLRNRKRGDDRNNENNKMKRKAHRNRYKSEEDNTQNGHWYSKLFEGRAKLRKNTDFMKDDDLMSEYKMYSNKYRSDSFSL